LRAAVALGWALALGTMTLAAQESSDSAAQTYPVRGVVLNSVSRQPVARVLVITEGISVLTDNDGRFELNLPAGFATITLRRPGYGPHRQTMSHTVLVGSNMPDLTFTLTPQALITGQVTLSTADAADGIRVMTYQRQVSNGRAHWTLHGMATTNSEGVFRIADLDPGSYLLYTQPARDLDGASMLGAPTFGYPAVYYPGVTDFSGAATLTLISGQNASADFTLTRQAFYSVTVTVADRETGGRLNFQVHDLGGRATGFPVRWNAQQGTAQVDVPNGRYFLEARNGGPNPLYGRVEFTVASAPIGGLSLSLLPLHGIPVVVRNDFVPTPNMADGSVGVDVNLIPADEFFGQTGSGSGLGRVAALRDEASFEIRNVPPGRYWVDTSAPEGYVSSVTSGGVDLAREPLVVGPGSTSAPIEITLRIDTGTITGQVNTGGTGVQTGLGTSAAAGEQQRIYVYAIQLFASTGPAGQGGGQATGQFTIANLAPGPYRVIAFDTRQEIDFHTPEGLAKYAGKGQNVTVEAGGTANAQVDLIRSTNSGDEQ
jgi:hypothetical protein